MDNEFNNVLMDVQKEYRKSNRIKDKIIILLIVFMFVEAVAGYLGFIWYESQFDYVVTETTETATETKTDVDMDASGESASAEYNDVEGNQYNDNAVHNGSGE